MNPNNFDVTADDLKVCDLSCFSTDGKYTEPHFDIIIASDSKEEALAKQKLILSWKKDSKKLKELQNAT